MAAKRASSKGGAGRSRRPAARAAGAKSDRITQGLNIKAEYYDLLRMVALARSSKNGGRPSVSDVVNWLIEQSLPALKKEAQHYTTERLG